MPIDTHEVNSRFRTGRFFSKLQDTFGDRRARLNFQIVFLLVFVWVVAVPGTLAQSYLQDISVPQNGGTVPVEFGYVNLPTGELHLEIPLGTFPQRGGGSGKVSLLYTSNLQYNVFGSGSYWFWGRSGGSTWNIAAPGDPVYTLGGFAGWTSFGPESSCGYWLYGEWVEEPWYNHYSGYSWTAPDGSSHLFPVDYYTPYDPYNCPYTTNGTSAYDQFGYYYSYTDGAIYGPDGTKYAATKTDPNGNNYPIPDPNGYSVQDTLGRALPGVTVDTDGTWHVAVPNAQGGTASYTVKWTTINVQTNFAWIRAGDPVSEYSGTATEVSEIDLPDGTAYHFYYDSGTTAGHYGGMTSMVLPTGATINYGYSTAPDYNTTPVRRLSSRTTPDSTTPWTYSSPTGSVYDCGTGCTTETFTVTAPSGDHSVHTIAFISNGPVPTETQYYDSASNLLGTAYSCYAEPTSSYNGHAACPSVSTYAEWERTADIVTLPIPGGNVTSMKQYTYDSFDNVTATKEWNFGSALSGAPDRTTSSTYYNNGYVVNRPATITVTNSSGGLVAKTVNTYDGSSLVTSGATGIINHDDTNYGISFTARGNLTQVQRYTSSTASTTESMIYDITGQLRTLTDGNGNVANYSYDDRFFKDAGDSMPPASYSPPTTNAYLTSVTQAYNTSVAETTSFGYYFGTGQMAKSTDPNSQTTYFHFYDSLSRPTSTKYPDSGWTYLTYPSASETQIDKYTGITTSSLTTNCSTSCRHDQTLLDSLGRTTSQILLSDPSGSDRIASSYDQNGRLYTTSNPYRSTSDSTYGTTQLNYDGLSRIAQTNEPDGSVAHRYYGAAVSSNGGRSSQMCSGYGVGYPILDKDEDGKLRQTWSDAFGRLIEVDEPDPSSGSLASSSTLKTCYTYDTLNNLVCADQWGTGGIGSWCTSSRHRYFEYDWLSRLTMSANPESGVLYFSYDANGNVLTKIDGRGITTGYSYDALNRLKLKNHWQGGSQVGQPEGFGYDGKDEWGNTLSPVPSNPIGRLTHGSNEVNAAENYWYDPMGRLTKEIYCTPQACNYSNIVQAQYDLAGNLTSLIYPNGSIVSQTFDGAGRLSTVGYSYWNGSSYVGANYLTINSYDPLGHVTSSSIGSGMVTTSASYNSRSEASSLAYNTTPATVWSRLYTWTPNGNLQQATDPIAGTTRQYGYDALNRITSALDMNTGTQNPASNGLTENFTYDAFGNLWESGNFTFWPTQYTNGNEPYGATYDAAGNLVNDGIGNTFTWDEEGRVSTANGVSYSYNAAGDRVGKSGSGATDSIYFTGRPVARLSGGAWTNLIYGGGTLLAEVPSTNPGTPVYRLTDHLGSSVATITSPNPPFNIQDYAPFGQLFNGSSSNDPYKFTGKERDSESGLDYFGARYYGSNMGRFMSPDPSGLAFANPANPQSLNLYSYALNNPLINIDPTGMECVWDDGSYDSADDPQTGNAQGCSGQGGTYVNPDLFENALLTNGQNANIQYGSWSGSANSMLASSWTTASATASANLSATPTLQDASAFYQMWLSGVGPATLNYGPNDGATRQLAQTPTAQGLRQQYINAGCPGSASYPSWHVGPWLHGYGTLNATEMQVGGFNESMSTSGGTTTYTITNTAGQASYSGATTSQTLAALNPFNSNGTADNPYGPNGPRHNIDQAFSWTEPNPCGH